MKLASFIMATVDRDEICREALVALHAQVVPHGWDVELILARANSDNFGLWSVVSPSGVGVGGESDWPHVGHQTEAAFRCSSGELILRSGDDDLHSPNRLAATIAAYERGAEIIGSGRANFYNPRLDRVARWDGPMCLIGTNMAYARNVLEQVSDWDVKRGLDRHIQSQIRGSWDSMDDWRRIASETICLHVEPCLSSGRPFPERFRSVRFGEFTVTGMGCLDDVAFRLPQHTLDVCRGLRGD